jgi:hypothetical protein
VDWRGILQQFWIKAASIQAAGHVVKPFMIDRLLDEVERICGVPET